MNVYSTREFVLFLSMVGYVCLLMAFFGLFWSAYLCYPSNRAKLFGISTKNISRTSISNIPSVALSTASPPKAKTLPRENPFQFVRDASEKKLALMEIRTKNVAILDDADDKTPLNAI